MKTASHKLQNCNCTSNITAIKYLSKYKWTQHTAGKQWLNNS